MSDDTRRPDDIDLLIPWYATGRLSPAEAERVRRALADDPDLAHQLALAHSEQDETRAVVEALPSPSPRARYAVFARIAALEGGAGKPAAPGLVARILAVFDGLTPRTVAWGAAAAALIIVAQAGLLSSAWFGAGSNPATFTTASQETAEAGSFALVGFAPNASMAEVTAFLDRQGMSIADGPRGGGLYRVRIAARAVGQPERDALLAILRARPDLVATVMPSV